MKRIVGVFFLSLFMISTAGAQALGPDLASGYKSTAVASYEGEVAAFTFDYEGNYIIAEKKGEVYKIFKLNSDGTQDVLVERVTREVLNLSFYQGEVYVVTRGRISKVYKGRIRDLITGLPAGGDYGNSQLLFYNNHMYFAVGTATNSGLVGPDNQWINNSPSVHDLPCQNIRLRGVNIETDNYLTKKKDDKASTGSFMPFNTTVSEGETIMRSNKCNGGLFRANPDGSDVQVYAWGFHNAKGLSIDSSGNVWFFDQGMEDRGIRPIKNGRDALYKVQNGAWYGWPDFTAGQRADQDALLAEHQAVPNPVKAFGLGEVQSLTITPDQFMARGMIAQTSAHTLETLPLSGDNFNKLFVLPESARIIQYKFGPANKLYVLSTLDGKTFSIHSVEPTQPVVLGSVAGISKTLVNWMVGFLIAGMAFAAFLILPSLKRPVA